MTALWQVTTTRARSAGPNDKNSRDELHDRGVWLQRARRSDHSGMHMQVWHQQINDHSTRSSMVTPA